MAQRDAAIRQLTANGPARVAALTANGQPSPDRRATLVVRGNHVEIIVESLGPTTGDETYWLWTLRCDTPKGPATSNRSAGSPLLSPTSASAT